MTDLTPDLVPLWTLLLALGILLYVLLDGFDLGVGILYCFAPDAASRTLLMNSIAPVWDGNETWLVLAGLALMAAFPLAFAILLALVFRGVAFEFRYKDAAHRTFWDYAFCYGSAVATFAQGIVIGAYIQGFKIDSRQFVGSSFDCFSLFSLFTGVALLFGYGLLGTGWLILKTEGTLQDWARHLGRRWLVGVAIALVVVSLWTPATDAAIARRWFSWSDLPLLAPIPVMTALLVIWEWRSLGKRSSEIAPFVTAVGIFALSYAGIVISLWPMIVPHRYSLWEAASSTSTQVFLVVGTVFLLPIIFMYTAWSYWVFRGKVRGEIGYSVSVLNDVATRNHRTNLVPGANSDERE
jgi:cytochrome d ubiquinol oxidase subunit II